MSRRRAGGPPNGRCQNCGRPAKSLRADFCSRRCRDEAAAQEARAEAIEQQAREYQRARATVIPDEELAEREPERPDEAE